MVIHAFGDEHTLGFKYDENIFVLQEYKAWLYNNFDVLSHEKFYHPIDDSIWVERLSKRLKSKYNLYAKSEVTNLDIFNQFVSNIDKLNEGDVVIINWAQNFKFNVYGDIKVKSVSNVFDNTFVKEDYNFSRNTVTDIFKNRSERQSIYEVHSYEKIISEVCKLKKINVFFWSIDNANHLEYSDSILKKPNYILGKHIIKFRNDFGVNFGNPFYKDLLTPLCYRALNYFDVHMMDMSSDTYNHVNSNLYLGVRGHDVLAQHFYLHIIKNIQDKSITRNLLL